MPADDLVLNVRQVAGYPPIGNAPTNAALLMQLGLGGAYVSVSPQALVSSALATGGNMAIGGQLSVASVSGASAQFSNFSAGVFGAQKACIGNLTASYGSIGGDPIVTASQLSAFAAQNVRSFNMRFGDIMLTADDIICAGGAPIYSPRFQGSPVAPTPPPWANGSQIATTAFVQMVLQEWTGNLIAYAPLDSPDFVGVPTAPTAPIGSTDGTIATTAFVMNAVSDSTTGVSSFNTRTGAVVLAAPDITSVGGALLAGPAFTGVPTAPTASPGTGTTQLATTAFVQAAVAGGTAGVTSFNTRTGDILLTAADIAAVGVSTFNGRFGAVTLQGNDVSAAGGALLAGPAFSGVPTAPTALAGTSTTQIATTGFVQGALVGIGGVSSFNTRTGAITLTTGDVTAVGAALVASPTFSGVPAAPTAAPGTGTTQLATTAFVQAAISAGVAGVASFNTRTGAVVLSTADVSGVGGALLASPTFSGVPAGPTAAVGTSTTQLATTAFVMNAAATTNPVMDGTAAVGTGTRWARNDHVHPSDTSRAALSGAIFTGGITATGLTSTGDLSVSGLGTITGGGTIGGVVLQSATVQGSAGAPIAVAMGTGLIAGCGGMAFNIPGLPAANLGFGWSNSPSGYGALIVAVNQGSQGNCVRSTAVSGQTYGVTLLQMQVGNTMYAIGDGPTTAGWSTTASDARLKSNLAAPSQDALAIVNDVEVSQCDFNPPGAMEKGEHWDFTVLAQDVEAVLPYAYMPAPPDGFASLHPLHLITVLWRAVQQLSQRLEALEARPT